MALGLTQPLTEMSTRNISRGVKGGRCVWLTTLPPSYVDCLEIWEPQRPGTPRACPGIPPTCFDTQRPSSGRANRKRNAFMVTCQWCAIYIIQLYIDHEWPALFWCTASHTLRNTTARNTSSISPAAAADCNVQYHCAESLLLPCGRIQKESACS